MAVTNESDVRVQKVHQGAVDAGGPITYTVTVSNSGPSTAFAVQLTDQAPPEVTVTGAASTHDGCTFSGTEVTCSGDTAVG